MRIVAHGHWEHGRPWRGDGPKLYQEIVHVPLLVKRPGGSEGAVVADLVSQMDVFPTFLEAAGSVHEAGRGVFCTSARKETKAGRCRSSLRRPRRGARSCKVALRRGDLKYSAFYRADSIEGLYSGAPSDEALYDLAADPGERHRLLLERRGPADALREALGSYLEAARERRAQHQEGAVSLDPELLRQLESLGYIEH